MFYPNDGFIQTATTKEEYKIKLDSILQMDYTWQHLIKATRFYHWRTFIPSLDFGKTIPADFDDRTIWPKPPLSMMKITNDVLSGKQDLIEYNIKKWQRSISTDSISQEAKAMKFGIRKFLDKLFYPPNSRLNIIFRVWRYLGRRITGDNLWLPPRRAFRDYRLKYSENTSQLKYYVKITKNNRKMRFIVASGSEAILVHNGKMLHRISPVAVRLAKLHENN
jgi:hypothetical protein